MDHVRDYITRSSCLKSAIARNGDTLLRLTYLFVAASSDNVSSKEVRMRVERHSSILTQHSGQTASQLEVTFSVPLVRLA